MAGVHGERGNRCGEPSSRAIGNCIGMYKKDRLDAMVEYLETHQTLGVDEAMRLYSASSATVRRDFSQLIASGVVLRGPNEIRRLVQHGTGVDQLVAVREMTMRAEKEAIARRAAAMLQDGDVAFIDGGTSTHALVRHLAASRLHIVTTCIRIANSLNELRQDNSDLEITMPGGVLMARSYVLYGPHTSGHLASYSARWAFIGVDGTDGASLYSVNEFIASNQRTMIANSDKVVLLMDHSKFGRPSMIRTAELDKKFVIVTDEHPSTREMADKAKRNGVEVLRVRA